MHAHASKSTLCQDCFVPLRRLISRTSAHNYFLTISRRFIRGEDAYVEADLEKVIRCNYTHNGAHSTHQVLEARSTAQLGDFTCSNTAWSRSLVKDPDLVGLFKLKKILNFAEPDVQ